MPRLRVFRRPLGVDNGDQYVHDLCVRHATVARARKIVASYPANIRAINEPLIDERGRDVYGGTETHPTYDDTDYKCHVCGKKLTGKDDEVED